MNKFITAFVCIFLFFCNGQVKSNQKAGIIPTKSHLFVNYIVFELSNADNSATDFFVINRISDEQPKILDTSKSLFALRNQENGYFINLIKQFLFIDYGSGPDNRQLCVFNISTGKKVLSSLYSDSISLYGSDSVSIWIPSNDTSFEKCSEYKTWKENGLDAVILVQHFLNLNSQAINKSANWKCEPKQ